MSKKFSGIFPASTETLERESDSSFEVEIICAALAARGIYPWHPSDDPAVPFSCSTLTFFGTGKIQEGTVRYAFSPRRYPHGLVLSSQAAFLRAGNGLVRDRLLWEAVFCGILGRMFHFGGAGRYARDAIVGVSVRGPKAVIVGFAITIPASSRNVCRSLWDGLDTEVFPLLRAVDRCISCCLSSGYMSDEIARELLSPSIRHTM